MEDCGEDAQTVAKIIVTGNYENASEDCARFAKKMICMYNIEVATS